MVAVIAVTLVMLAGTAMAQTQDCIVGVYADQMGTSGFVEPAYNSPLSEPFYVYSILFTEDLVNAVAWSVNIEGLGVDVLETGRFDYGNFNDVTPYGYRMGLGDCVIGFNHTPIKLIRHELRAMLSPAQRRVTTGPNALENPAYPIYSTCQSVLIPCQTGSLTIQLSTIPVESESWGSVKALYNN
jgi:hypothetical protein